MNEWWLVELRGDGSVAKKSDGPHEARCGADEAAYILTRLGLARGRMFAVACYDADVLVDGPLAVDNAARAGVNEEALDTLNAIGLK